ncbi:MAG: type II toxin-antitoxin system YafQ family toxin [Patescibacteria group bacterium]
MYLKFYTKQFQKSYNKFLHSGKIKRKDIDYVIDLLASGASLDSTYQDHALHGEYDGFRECHIRGDILLLYKIEEQKIVLVLFDIGTHSELF